MKYLIPIPDYQRIHDTIYSVLKSEEVDVSRSCIRFAIWGAAILRLRYNLDAHVAMGSMLVNIDDDSVMCFKSKKDIESDTGMVLENYMHTQPELEGENHFHAWVMVNNEWLIDFSAPTFPLVVPCKRKMMQKRLSNLGTGGEVGGVYIEIDNELTKKTLTEMLVMDTGEMDLLTGAVNLYRKPPTKPVEGMTTDGNGRVRKIPFISNPIEGVW